MERALLFEATKLGSDVLDYLQTVIHVMNGCEEEHQVLRYAVVRCEAQGDLAQLALVALHSVDGLDVHIHLVRLICDVNELKGVVAHVKD